MSVKDKVRGGKKAAKRIIKDLEELGHLEGMPVVLTNLNNVEVFGIIKEYLEENDIEYIVADVGCTVGIHSGDNATGLFFFADEK